MTRVREAVEAMPDRMTAVAVTPLRAFHGDPSVKETYLARVRAHAAADEIIHGLYWEDGKGCAVGCTVHSDDHSAYERELGLPTWLARLEDGMFEAQTHGAAKAFPERFLAAIPVGADCEKVKLPFLAWLMDDPTYGLAFTTRERATKTLAAEVGQRLRSGVWRDAWDAWAARDARAAWAAWTAWAARDDWDDFVAASVEELLRLLAALPPQDKETTP